MPLGQPTPAFSPSWQHGLASPGLKAHGRSRGGVALAAGGGGGPILVSQRWRPVGEQRQEHIRDTGTLLEWLEEDGAHCEWLSTATALGWRRVAGGRPEKESRLALKWTLRFMGLGRSLWPYRPGRRVDGEGRHQRCGCSGGRRCRAAPS
jgi:hypothetical protein